MADTNKEKEAAAKAQQEKDARAEAAIREAKQKEAAKNSEGKGGDVQLTKEEEELIKHAASQEGGMTEEEREQENIKLRLQNAALKAENEQNDTLAKQLAEAQKKAMSATESKPSTKLVKVKFIEAHEFYVGDLKFNAQKGDTVPVEVHMANKLTSRKLAYRLD